MSRRSLADIKDKIAKVRRQEEEKENQNPQLSQKGDTIADVYKDVHKDLKEIKIDKSIELVKSTFHLSVSTKIILEKIVMMYRAQGKKTKQRDVVEDLILKEGARLEIK